MTIEYDSQAENVEREFKEAIVLAERLNSELEAFRDGETLFDRDELIAKAISLLKMSRQIVTEFFWLLGDIVTLEVEPRQYMMPVTPQTQVWDSTLDRFCHPTDWLIAHCLDICIRYLDLEKPAVGGGGAKC